MAFDSSSTNQVRKPDSVDVAVGHRIRIRRKSIGVSQSALADYLGVSFQQVQKYENATNRVSASMLARVAEKLLTTVGELLGESGTSIPSKQLEMLSKPDALEVLDRFVRIEDEKTRRGLLKLLRELSPD